MAKADEPATATPDELLKQMTELGTRLFAIPKEKVADLEAKRPKAKSGRKKRLLTNPGK